MKSIANDQSVVSPRWEGNARAIFRAELTRRDTHMTGVVYSKFPYVIILVRKVLCWKRR